MKLNPKKIIGSLGRKYGRRSFQIVRKVYSDTLALISQIIECLYLRFGTYQPGHPDRLFLDKYYPSNKERNSENFQEGYIMMLDGRMYHGGLTDRIRGILTTYQELKNSGKSFFIHWNSPFPLEDYLVPSTFDWRIDPNKIIYDRKLSFPFIIEDEPDIYSRMRMKCGLRLFRPQIHVYSNADNARGNYRVLYNELFTPSPLLKKEVARHLKILGSSYEAFTFRFLALMGDFNEWSQVVLPKEDREEFIKKVTAEFLKLTKDIGKDQRILVTSDSRTFLDYISSVDTRVYVVDGDVKNIDLSPGEYKNAWLKTFTDQQLLMNAKKVTLMRTDGMYASGFPRFAAEVGGAEFIDHIF